MDRKKFIKSALLTEHVGAITPHILKAETKQNLKSTYDKLMHQMDLIIYQIKLKQ